MALPLHNSLGIYVSIPFCRSKCTYCNFASGVYPASDHGRYVDRMIAEIHAARESAMVSGVELPRIVDTVYLGGGTPSLLEPNLLLRLFDAMREEFTFTADVEITMECAPGQLPDETLAAMVSAGVNRVSLGVQSFIDREAASSGRLHTRAVVLDDVARLRTAGITNVNLDLIAGLAGQSFASWEESLSVLVETGVDHASVYMLEVDEDSRLGRELLAGGRRYQAGLVPNDDTIARMYTHALDVLSGAGLMQYEISNFAREGFISKHNLRYWQRSPYLGVGLDASSMLYEVSDEERRPSLLRSTLTSELAEYLAGTGSVERTIVTPSQQLEEAWFLGLRLNAGIAIDQLQMEFGVADVAPSMLIAERLAQEGLLKIADKNIRLTDEGRLLSNDVFQEFITLTDA